MSMLSGSSIVRERQRPLRRLYREEPARARIIKHAITRSAPGTDALHGAVTVGREYGDEPVRFGIDRAVGGFHDAPNPGELLVAALAACEDSTVRMVADILGVELTRLEVEVTGVVDVRGGMAVDLAAPVGFASMTCRVHLEAAPDTEPMRLAMLVAQAERSCINLATLRKGVPVEVTFEAGNGSSTP